MKKIISVATWLSMLFLIANIHPAHAAGRVGEPVTKAIPFTAPTDPSGRREPIPAKNTQ